MRVRVLSLAVIFLISAYSVNAGSGLSSADGLPTRSSFAKNSLRTAFSCTSDSSCSNQGRCDSSGTCSCYSGFGNSNTGFDCAIAPSVTCSSSYTNVSSLNASFSPSLSVDVANSVLSIGVSVPLETTPFVVPWDSSSGLKNSSTIAYSLDTSISFGSSSSCNYPPLPSSTAWTKVAADSDCKDQFQFSMQWKDAKTNCGFTYDHETKSWAQKVIVTRRYSIPHDAPGADNEKRTATTHVQSSVQTLRIKLSDHVDDIATVVAPSAISSSVLSAVSAPSKDGWEVTVMVLTSKPYKLAQPIASVTGVSSDRLDATQTSISDYSACNSSNVSCVQKISVFLSQCSSIFGQVAISLDAICSASSDSSCANVLGQVTITAYLDAETSCERPNTTIKTESLTAFTTADLNTTATAFNARDTAYFGAVISASDAVIERRTVESVCFILNPHTGNSVCVPFAFNLITSADSMIDPAFSIDLAQIRSLSNESADHVFLVRVTFGITWSPSGQSDPNESQVQSVTVIHVYQNSSSVDAENEAADNVASDEAAARAHSDHFKAITIASSSAAGAIVVGVLVIVAVVYRRRRQEREAEKAFNFSQLE